MARRRRRDAASCSSEKEESDATEAVSSGVESRSFGERPYQSNCSDQNSVKFLSELIRTFEILAILTVMKSFSGISCEISRIFHQNQWKFL